MGFGSYNLVTNALNIFKQAIDITSQNITNASNSNYAQEVPIIQDTYPTGVNLQDVQRIQNLYFFQLLQNKSASLDYFNTRLQYNKQVQNIFNVVGPNSSSTSYDDAFFSAFTQLFTDTSNVGYQNQTLTTASNFVQNLNSNASTINNLSYQVPTNSLQYLNQINTLVKNLASLNQQITTSYALTYSNAHNYKELLDQRDAYISQLSKLISVNIQEDSIGRVHISINGGFTLVDGTSYWKLALGNSGNSPYQTIEWLNSNNQAIDITNNVQGGELKAMIDFSYDVNNYKVEQDNIAANAIMNTKIPVQSGSNYYLVQNLTSTDSPIGNQNESWSFPPNHVSSTAATLSSLGVSNGSLTFYSGTTSSYTISNYGSLNLVQLSNSINSSGMFNANISLDPSGNYYLQITPTYSNTAGNSYTGVYNIVDSSSNIVFNSGSGPTGVLSFTDNSSSGTYAQLNYTDMSLDQIVNAINNNPNLQGKYSANIVSSPFVDMPIGLSSSTDTISQTGVLTFRNNTTALFSITYTNQSLVQIANELSQIPSATLFSASIVKEQDGLYHLRLQIKNPNEYNIVDSGSSFSSLYSLHIASLNQAKYGVQDINNSYVFSKNVISNTVSLSSYGIGQNATLTFYNGNVALYSISNYGQYSLNSLTSLIDSNPTLIGLFSASVVANQDGTYSLYVSSSNTSNYTMTDSSSNMNMGGGNVYKSEMAFEGIDALSISINPSLGAILQNVDPNAASNFSYYSNSWWGSSKSLYQNLIGSVASTVNVLQTSYSSMSSLVNSISSQVSQVQGVSLDQQYITLQNLQQDYQASASIVGILNNLMQTTLNMVNGG